MYWGYEKWNNQIFENRLLGIAVQFDFDDFPPKIFQIFGWIVTISEI